MTGAPASPALTPQVVIDSFENDGEFFCAGDKAYWQETYFNPSEPDEWTPPIAVRSDEFRRMMQARFNKLTKRAAKTKDVLDACEDAAFGGRRKAAVQWSRHTGPALQVSISKRHAVEIDAQGVRCLRNGADAVFTMPPDFVPLRWADVVAAWTPDGYTLPALHAAMLDHLPPSVNTDITTTEDHAAIIAAFWLGTICESMMKGRPLLAILGGFGSGKTVTARILGKLYFGQEFDVEGGTGGSRAVKDLLASINSAPLAVRDDMNREPVEIVDTICRLATGSRVTLSTLHETLEVSKFTARGAIVVTAHTPSWALRPDLLSRMLIVRIDKAPAPEIGRHLTETERYDRACELRTRVWADTFHAIHRAMQVHTRWVTSTRFEDWETLARRAAEAGGWHMALHSALSKMPWQRVNVAQYTDPWLATILVVASEMADPTNADKWYSAAEMYDLIAMRMGGCVSQDAEHRPSASAFRSQRTLGQWLGQIERDGAAVCDVERGPLRAGVATWRLRPKA
jgi:hypothetical protein